MSSELYMRQSGLIDSTLFETPICLIGAGGIGSFTALALAKIGFSNIAVWDFDKVEEHNLPNQFYPISAIGEMKVVALQEMIKQFTGNTIHVCPAEFNKDSAIDVKGIVIMAVDSMKARKEIWNIVRRNPDVIGVIDGRMGGNQLEVYTCRLSLPSDKKRYEGTLCSDSRTANIPCTQRAVMYNVLSIASWITNQARLLLSNKPYANQLILDMENMILVVPQEPKE